MQHVNDQMIFFLDMPSEIIMYILSLATQEDNLEDISNNINSLSCVNTRIRDLIKADKYNYIINNVFQYYIKNAYKVNSKYNIISDLTKVAGIKSDIDRTNLLFNNILNNIIDKFKNKKTKIKNKGLIKRLQIFLKNNRNNIKIINKIYMHFNESLIKAVTRHNIKYTKLLIKFSDSSNHKNKALLIATKSDNERLVKILIKNGANVNTQEYQNKQTPIIIATLNGYENIVRILIKNNANIDMQDIWGNTALIYATLNSANREDNAELLYNIGGHIQDIKNIYDDIFDILIEAKANINIANNDGETVNSLSMERYNNTTDCALL